MTARNVLINMYLDYFDNYCSTTTYAERNGLTTNQALNLLTLAKEVYLSKHPES